MKKIYMTLFAGILFSTVTNAQTLTLAGNQPVAGDVNNYKGYDSVGVIPKNMGANQTWNFGAYPQNTVTSTTSFSTTIASTAIPVGTTLVEVKPGGNYTFWKSSATPTLESLGYIDANIGTLTFTNSAVVAVWPVTSTSSITDVFSGTIVNQLGNGTCGGTITAMGAGTGTITLPGGFITLTNILQTKVVQTLTVTTAAISGTLQSTDYSYYHSSQKFPVLFVSYSKQTLTSILGPTVTTSASVKGNAIILTGVNDKNFDATFAIFPNPAKESFNVSLTNINNENSTVVIYNSVGQVVKTIELGNASVLEKNIVISDLSSGIYIVKTSLGNKTSARRLIVE